MIKVHRTEKRLADAEYMFLYLVHSLYLYVWILQCIFIVKLIMSSLKKLYSLVPNNRHSTQPFGRVF